MSSVIKINSKEQFLDEISDGRAVVDFWAEWCGPCRAFAPEFDTAAGYVKDVKFLSVDVDKHIWATVDYGVRTIPNVQLFKNGQFIRNVNPAKHNVFADTISE